MKILLALALLTASVSFAATSVDGNLNVIVDGSNFGRAEDYIAKKPEQAAAVFLAMRAYHADVATQAASDVAAAEAKAKADTASANAAAAAQVKSAAEDRDGAVAKVQADADAAIKAAQAERDAAIAAKAEAEKAAAAADALRVKESARVSEIIAALKATQILAPLPPAVARAILSEDERAKAALSAQKAELEAKLAALQAATP